MKSLLELHSQVAHDMGEWLGVDPRRDIETMSRRSASEGEEFLMISLPAFCDGVLHSISVGSVVPSAFPSFRVRGGLPVFLQGYMELLFTREGALRDDADHRALIAIRQVCNLSKKIERPVKGFRLLKAQESFVATDEEVGRWEDTFSNDRLAEAFQAVCKHLYRDIWYRLMGRVDSFSLIPRHGPGAVAEKFSPREKWEFGVWFESLEPYFPSSLYTSHNGLVAPLPVVPISDEGPVRVVFVPKTVKTPRVIAIEPLCRQYCQQAVQKFLYKELQRKFRGLDLFDQTRNQKFAMRGSRDSSFATLDLSEASDRVSVRLVEWLTSSHPDVFEVLSSLRTRQAELPSGEIISLRKFASMGSALTFPLESMVFFAIAVLGVMKARHLTDPSQVKLGSISVFGDDIIVPGDSYHSVAELLESFGLKVNLKKSYGTGPYRESCGKEYFRGRDVTIAKLTKDIPTSRSDAQLLASFVALRNEMYLRSLDSSVDWIDSRISAIIPFNQAPVGHPSLSAWTTDYVQADRTNPLLQVGEIKRPVLKPIDRVYTVDGLGGVLRWFLSREGSDPDVPKSQYDSVERPVAFTINNRWCRLS